MTKVTHLSVGEAAASRTRQLPQRDSQDLDGPAETPLGTFGQVLRGARMARGEDLGAVSRALKIRKDHLEALENDDVSRLPGRTYAVGFVRAYADYLGLKPSEAVDRFKAEVAGRDDPSRNAGFSETEEEPGLSIGWWLLGLIVLGVIAYGAYYLLTSPGAPPQTVAPVPAQMLEKKPQPTKPARAAGTDHAVNAPGAWSGAAPGSATFGHIYGAENTNSRIVLRAVQTSHVLVQSPDGNALFNQVLQPGDTFRVPNQANLSLTAEHGNAVELLVDGKSAGRAGNTADLTAAMSLDPGALAARGSAAP